MAEIEWKKVYAGLAPHDWHMLKELVLGASYGERNNAIPPHLLEHEASRHLLVFVRTGDEAALNRAAEALCPLYPEKAWLALAKS